MSASHNDEAGETFDLSSGYPLEASTTREQAFSAVSIPPATPATDPASANEGLGNTFLQPSTPKVNQHNEAAMVEIGKAAEKEAVEKEAREEDEEAAREGDQGGAGLAPVPAAGITVASTPVPVAIAAATAPVFPFAPNKLLETQTRLLTRRFSQLEEEADASRETKRPCLEEFRDESESEEEADKDKDLSSLDFERHTDKICERVEKMEAKLAMELAKDESAAAGYLRRRLLLNLKEKERLLKQFREAKEKEKEAEGEGDEVVREVSADVDPAITAEIKKEAREKALPPSKELGELLAEVEAKC